MSLLSSHTGAIPRSDATSKSLKPDSAKIRDAARTKLQKATREFEALFSFYMLKAMRQSIGTGDDKKEGALSSGLGKDTFTEMFDMKMAEKIATRGNKSVSQLMYDQMVRQLDQKDAELPLNTSLESLRQHQSQPISISASKNSDIEPVPGIALSLNEARMNRIPDSRVLSVSPLSRTDEPEPFEFDLRPDVVEQFVSEPLESPVSMKSSSIPDTQSVGEANHTHIFEKFGDFIDKASQITSLDSNLIASVIHAESSGDPLALSASGAKGLMQLMDSTAVQYDVSKPFDPEENITGGSRYLKDLIDRFGDLKLALAAYNAGPTNVRKFNGIPPFAETLSYVSKVMDNYSRLGETAKLDMPKGNSVADR